MKIYLASNRENIELVKEFAAKLEALGHEITYPWWKDIEKNGSDDRAVSRDELVRCAEADRDGVRSCDLFWLLAPETGGTGCWVELGMALEKDESRYGAPPIVIVSGSWDRTLFCHLAAVDDCFERHDSAFIFITQYMRAVATA